MVNRERFLFLLGLFLVFTPLAYGQDYQLQYFLGKTTSKGYELSKEERTELLNRMDEILDQAQQIHGKLTQALQSGEIVLRYQEGKYWMEKLEKDKDSILTGSQQIKLLKEKPLLLVGSVTLYKCLKDLSSNFNAYNNVPSFSAYVGDLAPEIELWADPIFYKLYLLPLAEDKNGEPKLPAKTPLKKPEPKGKKP